MRTVSENIVAYNNAPGSIVAAQNGVIKQITASKGTIVCQIGQQINKGDVLISGYTNCGIVLRAGSAAGEIYARTLHKVTVAAPLDWE